MEKADVLVAGAGPVGLYLACLLERSGLRVRVLEEHGSVGRPNHCSGLVSRNLDLFVKPGDWIEHEVYGAVIRAGKSSLCLEKSRPAAYVIDRQRFDASLAEGLDVRLGTRVEGICLKEGVRGHLQARNRVEGVLEGEEGDHWKEGDKSRLPAQGRLQASGRLRTGGIAVKTSKGVFKADMLLGCDGANSVVARAFGSRPEKRLMGVIGITGEGNHSRNVEIMIDKKAAPEGFFWKIPRGRTTEYGMFSGRADFLALERFFGIRPAERRAGLIPIGPGKSYFPHTLLVGDAAGMSKPWSGGGLIFGLTAARIAAKVVQEAFGQEDFSEGFLSSYERGWKAAFGRQIQAGMLGRKVFERIGNQEIEMALKCMEIFSPLLNRMDMDFLVR